MMPPGSVPGLFQDTARLMCGRSDLAAGPTECDCIGWLLML
jgi:hypothetical protein